MKTAPANKQLVITKNIFEFRVSKLKFLFKAATASDVLRSKKKENQLYSLCSEENSSLIFSHSSIKKTNTNHCIKYKELLF